MVNHGPWLTQVNADRYGRGISLSFYDCAKLRPDILQLSLGIGRHGIEESRVLAKAAKPSRASRGSTSRGEATGNAQMLEAGGRDALCDHGKILTSITLWSSSMISLRSTRCESFSSLASWQSHPCARQPARSDLLLVSRQVLGVRLRISRHPPPIPLRSQTHRPLIHRAMPAHFGLLALSVLDRALSRCGGLRQRSACRLSCSRRYWVRTLSLCTKMFSCSIK